MHSALYISVICKHQTASYIISLDNAHATTSRMTVSLDLTKNLLLF